MCLAMAVIRAVRASRKKSGAVGAGSRRGRWRGSLDAVVTAGEWTNTHRKWHAKRHGRGAFKQQKHGPKGGLNEKPEGGELAKPATCSRRSG